MVGCVSRSDDLDLVLHFHVELKRRSEIQQMGTGEGNTDLGVKPARRCDRLCQLFVTRLKDFSSNAARY